MKPDKYKWTIEYDNDVGLNDEGFWEWWDVTNGEVSFRCDTKHQAEWLCEWMNMIPKRAVTRL